MFLYVKYVFTLERIIYSGFSRPKCQIVCCTKPKLYNISALHSNICNNKLLLFKMIFFLYSFILSFTVNQPLRPFSQFSRNDFVVILLNKLEDMAGFTGIYDLPLNKVTKLSQVEFYLIGRIPPNQQNITSLSGLNVVQMCSLGNITPIY